MVRRLHGACIFGVIFSPVVASYSCEKLVMTGDWRLLRQPVGLPRNDEVGVMFCVDELER